MYIDKEDAIKLADNARKAIDNLEKAIEECPTLIRKENGELV